MLTPWPCFVTAAAAHQSAYQPPASVAVDTVFDALSVLLWHVRKRAMV
jgi:hypothetical protein